MMPQTSRRPERRTRDKLLVVKIARVPGGLLLTRPTSGADATPILPKNGFSGMTMPGMNSAVIVSLSRPMIFCLTDRSQFAGMKPQSANACGSPAPSFVRACRSRGHRARLHRRVCHRNRSRQSVASPARRSAGQSRGAESSMSPSSIQTRRLYCGSDADSVIIPPGLARPGSDRQ